jgi:hypothetical protein
MFTLCSAMLELANRQLDEAAGSDAAASAPAGAEALTAAMHASASEALHELQRHGMLPLVLAAMFHNCQPYYHAAGTNWLTSKQDIAPRSHWRRVLQRLRRSAAQLLHLRILHAEFGRLSAAAAREGESLVEVTAALSIAIADRLQDGGWHAGGDGGSDGGSCTSKSAPPQPAAATAIAGDTPDEGLSRQLQAYLERLNIHTCVTGFCITNVLTLRQIATIHVGGWHGAGAALLACAVLMR